jgi:hypothetical protein
MANRLEDENNSRVYKMLMRRQKLDCDRCKPHRNENAQPYVYNRKKKEFQLTPRQKNWF